MKSERGFSLLEVMIAIGLLGILGIAFFSALNVAFMSIFIADERATTESLARSQMEYVESQPYRDNGTYEKIAEADIPDGYDIELPTAVDLEDGIQKITVTISHHGKPIITSGDYTLEGYKVKR